MRKVLCAIVLAGLMGLCGCASVAPVWVAGSRQAPPSIVIPPEASPRLRLAADDLARCLSEMSGTSFSVVEGDGTSGIVLGTPEQFPTVKARRELAIHDTYDGREAYVIDAGRERILLLGATDLGASHAAYRYLEQLGCRWFFPAREWEVIPKLSVIPAPTPESGRPVLLSRGIWYGYGYFDRNQKRCAEEYQAWCRRNFMGQSLKVYCGHAWQSIILAHKAEFEAHPEYLALVKGKRQGWQLCVSNPGLRKLVTDYAVNYFDTHPDADMVSLDCSDGGGQCECEECAKLGSVSNRVFGLASEAAEAVAKAHPGKMVGLYAYNEHSEPPDFKLAPNVYIQLTHGFIRGRYTFDELSRLWPQYCSSMGYYDYFSVYLWDWDMPPGGKGGNVPYLRKWIAQYVERGGTTLSAESGDNWGIHGRGYYLASRLMWNPDADADAILADFYTKAFGPAAGVMQRYYERLDPSGKPLMSEQLIAACLRDLEEASRLAADRPDVLARLDQLKQYQHYVCLRWQLGREPDKAKQKPLALAILTHVYRNRYTYMNHWEAIRQYQSRHWAKDYEEPGWAFNDRTPNKPWMVDRPNTPAETAAEFAEDLARFRPVEVIERSFSDDLVPGGFSSGGPVPPLALSFQGGGDFILGSRSGEPLAWTVTVGTIAWYRNRPDGSVTLTDDAGKVLLTQPLPLTGEPVAMTSPVPGPGRYRLAIRESSAGFALQVPAGAPVVLPLERGRRYLHGGHMPRQYFYVPKGTTELCYFINNSSAYDLHGPDGKVVFHGTRKGVYERVPVPAGLDGTVWSVQFLVLGQLWFFNAPNVLAPSPEALMVPREVAGE